jgi:hypothetical protein
LNFKNFDEEKLKNLLISLIEWKKQIEKNNRLENTKALTQSISEYFELKNSISNEEKEHYFSNKFFSKRFLELSKNPKNNIHQINWLLVWSMNSIETIWKLSKDLWFWILKSIPDLLEISRWNAEYKSPRPI